MVSNSPLFLTALFFATMIAALMAFESGLRIGTWRRQRPDPEPPLPVRALVGSILSLLAFILGFTFGLASSHYDLRSEAVFNEATAIGKAYRQADLIAEPARANLRGLMRQYVDLHLKASQGNRDEILRQVRQLQEQIWTEAIAAGRTDPARPSAAPLIQQLVEVIEVHGERLLAGSRSRIPSRVWVALYLIMAISLCSAGYQSGLAGARRSIAAFGYALVFAAVITMIAAGDIPGPEQVRLNSQPLIDLRARLTVP
jgi:hypothetical protein